MNKQEQIKQEAKRLAKEVFGKGKYESLWRDIRGQLYNAQHGAPRANDVAYALAESGK